MGRFFIYRIAQLAHMHKIILRLQDKSIIIGNSKTLLVRMRIEKGIKQASKRIVQNELKN